MVLIVVLLHVSRNGLDIRLKKYIYVGFLGNLDYKPISAVKSFILDVLPLIETNMFFNHKSKKKIFIAYLNACENLVTRYISSLLKISLIFLIKLIFLSPWLKAGIQIKYLKRVLRPSSCNYSLAANL